MKLTRRATTAGLLSFAAAAPALAQAKRTVTIVVPFPPGGSVDALARLMQEGLQERLNANIIIENKAGANGSLGAAQVARAAPDGNTLMVTFDSHSTIPALIEKPPLNVETDLVPVMLVGKAPYIVATSVKKPYKTFADVIAAAKTKPVSYGTSGPGSSGHLAMVMLARKAGAPLDHVPYKGAGPARLKDLPDAPTTAESGFPDFLAEAWWGFFAPKGTPAPIVDATYAALRDVIMLPNVTKRLQEAQQMTLIMDKPDAFATFFAKEVVEWGKVVRDNNIKGE